jgi:predicted RNA-binding protein with PUA-like domain
MSAAPAAARSPRFWLMKTEPVTFSLDDLLASPSQTSSWEGVRNYQARNLMRDEFKLGDQCFIYHSSCAEPGIVGLAEVVREAHSDDTALDPSSAYYDEKSFKDGVSRWCMVAVQARARFRSPLLLSQMREEPGLLGLMVLQRGARLSIQPVSPAHGALILKLGKPQKV